MGHSFVEYQGKVTMLTDADLILVAHALLDTARSEVPPQSLPDNVQRLLETWTTLLDTYGPGCVDLGIAQTIETDEDRRGLLDLMRSTALRLQRFGDTLPADYLNQIVNAPAILRFESRPTHEILAAMSRIAELIRPQPSRSA